MPRCRSCAATVNLKLCSQCGNVQYCSKECQKLDWCIHKHDCKTRDEQSMDQSNEQSSNKSKPHSVDPVVDNFIDSPTGALAAKPTTSINRSNKRSNNQSTRRSIDGPIDLLINRSTGQPMHDSLDSHTIIFSPPQPNNQSTKQSKKAKKGKSRTKQSNNQSVETRLAELADAMDNPMRQRDVQSWTFTGEEIEKLAISSHGRFSNKTSNPSRD